MAIPLVQNKDSGLVVRSIINDLVNYSNNASTSVSGSFTITQNLTTGIVINPQTVSYTTTISSSNNAFVCGPIASEGELIIEPSANLIIIGSIPPDNGTNIESGSTSYSGSISFNGSSSFTGSTSFSGSTGFNGSSSFTGSVGFTGSHLFMGTASFSGSLRVTGSTYIQGLTTSSQTNIVTINPSTGQLFYTASSAISTSVQIGLQQVLDYNHDLTNGNNFQGTNAGLGSNGINITAIGEYAAAYSTGDNVNALGYLAAFSNSGSYVNAIGSEAAYANTGSYVNAIGYHAGAGNKLSNQFIISNQTLPSFVNWTAASASINVAAGAATNNTYLYYDQTTKSIGAVRL